MDKKQAPPAGGFPQYALPAQAMPHAQQQFLAQQQMVRFCAGAPKNFCVCLGVLARPPRARAPRDSLGGLVVGHKKAAVRQALSRAVQGRCPKEPRGTRKKMHTRSRAAQPAPPPPSHPLSSSHALRDSTR